MVASGIADGQIRECQERLERFLVDLPEPVGRGEPRHWGAVYVRGRSLDADRKSVEPMASRLPVRLSPRMYTTERMRRFASYCLTLLAIMLVAESSALCAVNWKLILKDGSVIECDGAPMIVDGVYMFRQTDGKGGNLAADRIDVEKTYQANKVERRQWRAIGGSAAVGDSTSSEILTLRDADFDAQVLESRTPVMVEFWATWCGYCQRFEPTVQAIASEYAGRLRVGKVDVDKNPATVSRYGVDGTPTVVLFKGGKVMGTIDGFTEKAEVVRMLRSGL